MICFPSSDDQLAISAFNYPFAFDEFPGSYIEYTDRNAYSNALGFILKGSSEGSVRILQGSGAYTF